MTRLVAGKMNDIRTPIYLDTVCDELEVCEYCGGDAPSDSSRFGGCCGEVHFKTAYVVDGELLMADEVVMIDRDHKTWPVQFEVYAHG